jgi:hypothetical protein
MYHCFLYFFDELCPKIVLIDGDNSIILNELFNEKTTVEGNTEAFTVGGETFHLLHVKIEDRTYGRNRLCLCANNRLVQRVELGDKIADLDRRLFDRNGCWYLGVLSGEHLDENLNENRLSFNMPEHAEDNLLQELTLTEIVNEACNKISEFLAGHLPEISKAKMSRIRDYVTNEAPQYRHLLKYEIDAVSNIKPGLTDEKLDDELHGIKREFDKKAKASLKLLLKDACALDITEYEKLFQKEVLKISEANSSALAQYVSHRKAITDLFEHGLRRKEDGKFNVESYMHNLIYPMRNTSDEVDYESHNLWLIDEKLSYCTFISSDVPFDNDPSQERTDILVLDNPFAVSDCKNDGDVFDTIVIFEMKRPMLNNYGAKQDPMSQLFQYAVKIRSGKACDRYGRPIRVNSSTKFYLYASCDITPTLENLLDIAGFTPTTDNSGYFFLNPRLNAYAEVMSYSKVLRDAKKRNRVLFDKLGLIP